ncbi:MAG TPA: winged helix-turn-helix domain-containing protein [Burkholderiaceae bacterium]
MQTLTFHFGDWRIEPGTRTLSRGADSVQIDPRAMDVLVALCLQAGEVVSADELMRRCWAGMVVGENQVHKAIAQLRRALGDSAGTAAYIENIRKRGYRTVAPVLLAPGGRSQANAKSWADESPYVGLDAFGAAHAPVFFGRDAAIGQLHDAVVAQARSGGGLVLVLGPSGSGKTSLVQAGLIPALSRTEEPVQALASAVLDLGGIGDEPLLTALGSALLDLDLDGKPLLAGRNAEGIGIDLHRVPDVVLAELGRLTANRPNARAILFVDRLEALFSNLALEDEQRQSFLAALDKLASSGSVAVIAACRNDFYPQIADQPLLMAGKPLGRHFDLHPPNRAEIALMIRLPAAAAGLGFGIDENTQARLDDLLCEAAAHGPDALPLLQYTLHELYLQRGPAGELTMEAYRMLGGLEGAIGRRAEATLADLPEASQAALPRVLSMLVTLGANEEVVGSHRAPWSALQGEAEHTLVRALVEHRLFVSHMRDKVPVFGVAHEALLRQWPRAVEWVAMHRQALRVRSRLEGQARQWIADGRHAHRLLPRGKPLIESSELIEHGTIPLSDDVQALIRASVRRVKLGDRLRFGALASFVCIAALAAAMGLRASRAQDVALKRQQEADDLMGYLVGELADKLRPLGRLDLLDGANGKALQYLQANSDSDDSPENRLQHAQTLQTIAEVARSRGDIDRAMQALQKARSLVNANLAQSPYAPVLLKQAGGIAFWIGQIDMDHGRYNEARVSFDEYLALSKRMVELAPADPEAVQELAYANYDEGDLALEQNKPALAQHSYQSALTLWETALQVRQGNRVLRAEHAKSAGRLARAESMLGRLPQAMAHFRQQTSELRRLVDEAPTEWRWQVLTASAEYNEANAMQADGQLDEAQESYASALRRLREANGANPGNRLWQREQLLYEYKFAMLDLWRGRAERCAAALEQIDSRLTDLIRQDPKNAISLRVLATVKLGSAKALIAQGKLPAASARLGEAVDLLSRTIDYRNGTSGAVKTMAEVLIEKGMVERGLGRLQSSGQACQSAVNTLEPLVPGSEDYELLDPWIRAHACLGREQEVRTQEAQLQRMGYRHPDYLFYLQNNRSNLL